MFEFLGSVVNVAASVVKIVSAPVQIVASAAEAVIKPIGDVAQELAKDVNSALK